MMPLLERHFHVTLIELVAFEISVVVACCKAHLVRLPALDKGGGTDSSDVEVIEGDDALSGAAGKVRWGALSVGVVFRPAEAASAIVRALSAVMTGILAVAGEAVGEGWQLAFAKHRPWRSPRFSYSATF
jgi:hypothetical protein